MTYTREQAQRDASAYRRAVLLTPRPVTEPADELVALALAGDRYALEQAAEWPAEASERSAWRAADTVRCAAARAVARPLPERWTGYDR